MNGDYETPVNRDALLETFAAELTLAAYRVALQTRTGGTWLDLELDLWRVTAEASVVKAGSTLNYVECDVKDQAGRLVARAASTCMKLKLEATLALRAPCLAGRRNGDANGKKRTNNNQGEEP